MKLFQVFQLGCVFLFSYGALQAEDANASHCLKFQECPCLSPCSNSHFGNSGFGNVGPDQWYTISTNSYPEVTPLSQQGNMGSSQGGVYNSPSGFTIGEAGNYWVSITAVLQNPGTDTILIPVFLVQNEVFEPDNPLAGGVVTLEPNQVTSLHGTGIIQDITPGTRLSLVATNAGYPLPIDVTVAAWNISLFKLP